MTLILSSLALIGVCVLAYLYYRLYRAWKQSAQITLKMFSEMVTTVENTIKSIGEHSKIHESQNEVNEIVGRYLEVLAVHTKLIKPTIGFEAEQFLAWINKKKEEK